jgi:hypothetical protein
MVEAASAFVEETGKPARTRHEPNNNQTRRTAEQGSKQSARIPKNDGKNQSSFS